MKLTMKLFLIISLFCSVALADDGDMNTGNKSDDGSGGGLTCAECVIYGDTEDNAEKDNSIIMIIRDFLSDLLG